MMQSTTLRATEPETIGGQGDRALKLWIVLARAYAAVARHAEADAAEDGLTLAEFAILETLLHERRLRVGEKGADLVKADRATVSARPAATVPTRAAA